MTSHEIETLRRSVRTWKFLTCIAITAQLAACFFGSEPVDNVAPQAVAAFQPDVPKRIECQELAIVTSTGKEVVRLASINDQGGRVWLNAPEGTSNIILSAVNTPSGASILLNSEQRCTTIGSREFTIMDGATDANIGAWIESQNLIAKGSAGQLTDQEQQRLPELANHLEHFLTQRRKVSLSTIDTGGGIIEVFNPVGKKIASLGTTNTNAGGLFLFDFNGQPKKAFIGE
jgi:hypothetical protein